MKSRLLSLVALVVVVVVSPFPVYAKSICDSGVPGCTCTGPVGGPQDVPSLACFSPIITNVINYLFIFLGAAGLIFLLYGAIKFVISGGDQKALQSARGTMTYAVIGIVLILLSYVIINFVLKTLGLPSVLDTFTFYVK